MQRIFDDYMGKLYTKTNNIFFQDSRKELYLYLALWLLLFLTPLFSIYMRLSHIPSETAFPWNELFLMWQQYAIFLVMFLVHNYLLAPLLVYRQRRMLYFSSLAVLLGVFLVLQCGNRPDEPKGPHGHDNPPAFAERMPHDDEEHFGPPPPPDSEDFDKDKLTSSGGRGRPLSQDKHLGPPPRFKEGHRPPIIVGQHDVVATIIFILMVGMNLGVKLYFRQRKDQERLLQLENDNLEQQLEYLKYQINPHFLMNTLNNIHALVDIDPEQAKETIVELSKIMRFVLYEGSKQKVALRQELMFLKNYIELMKMRFTDHVAITVNLPDLIPDQEIPPLLLITFVENAFKHGVSYQQQSFVDIDIYLDKGVKGSERGVKGSEGDNTFLHFTCRNSKVAKAEGTANPSEHGVGLQNARRRLDLLYGNSYKLDINDAEDIYTVTLKLPL